jgi:hypothetical protein
MPNPLARIAHGYGASPLHLLSLLGCFALAGYAAAHLIHQPTLIRILIWFVAALVGHDLVLFPLYALADRSLSAALRGLWPRRGPAARVPPLNYLRLPLLGAGLLLLVFLPGIIRQGQSTYHAATGQDQHPFLDRWLLLTAAMFLLSAVSYTIRVHRTGRHPTSDSRPDRSNARQPPTP